MLTDENLGEVHESFVLPHIPVSRLVVVLVMVVVFKALLLDAAGRLSFIVEASVVGVSKVPEPSMSLEPAMSLESINRYYMVFFPNNHISYPIGASDRVHIWSLSQGTCHVIGA